MTPMIRFSRRSDNGCRSHSLHATTIAFNDEGGKRHIKTLQFRSRNCIRQIINPISSPLFLLVVSLIVSTAFVCNDDDDEGDEGGQNEAKRN